jgi:hypothetical protein
MNGERGGGHKPTVETCLRNNSFAAKNSAARGGGRVNFAGHVGSHRPPRSKQFARQFFPAGADCPRQSISKK